MANDAASKTVKPQSVHLLGICGTAMAALAGSLKEMGHQVSGSDENTYPPMSDQLAGLGISFQQGYGPENIPEHTDLVVVGNVIRESNPEAREMRRRGLPHLSMAEAVHRFLIGERESLVVAGTHGKTTTTALAGQILLALGADPGVLVGGFAPNFNGNFRLGGGEVFVIEGDEYDTAYFDKTPKFFKYRPSTLIFTSLEFDHADIYPDLATIRGHFAELIRGLPADGALIACTDHPAVAGLISRAPCRVVSYGEGEADFRIEGWRAKGSGGAFESLWEGKKEKWRIPLPGLHNALNAAAAIVLARLRGYESGPIQKALMTFRGVRRRQEVRGTVDEVTVIDDFAHHPTAVRLTIEAVRGQYPGGRVWAVFEPRSFTARSDRFQQEFAQAFLGASRVLLAPPYRSGVSDENRPLDTEALAAFLNEAGVWAEAATETKQILACLLRQTMPGDAVLIMSNGEFDGLHDKLLEGLKHRKRSGSRRRGNSR